MIGYPKFIISCVLENHDFQCARREMQMKYDRGQYWKYQFNLTEYPIYVFSSIHWIGLQGPTQEHHTLLAFRLVFWSVISHLKETRVPGRNGRFQFQDGKLQNEPWTSSLVMQLSDRKKAIKDLLGSLQKPGETTWRGSHWPKIWTWKNSNRK